MNTIKREDIDKIVFSLNKNRLVVIETDTVFGLMAKATKNNEIKINKFKKRDLDKKVSIIFPDKKSLYKYMYDISYYKKEYLDSLLPGKYTFIVKLNNFSNFNRIDYGVRITSCKYLQDIIKKTGPLLASSCNISGNNPLTNIKDIKNNFKDKDIDIVESNLVLDKSSTIIDLINDIKIIRE